MRHLLLALCIAAPPVFADPIITLTSPAALNWATTPEGVAFASLSGNRWTEPYFAMVRLPAGTVSPVHTKSASMFGIVVEGEMTHAAPGTNATPIGPGSYFEVPALMPHVSACVSDRDCVTMLYQDGAFDFLPVSQ